MDNDTDKARAGMITPNVVSILSCLGSSRFAPAAPEPFRTYFLLHLISLGDTLVVGIFFDPPKKPTCTPLSNGLNIRSAAFHNVPVRKGIIIYTHASVMRNQNQSVEATYLVPHGDPNY